MSDDGNGEQTDLRMPDEGELFATVTEMLGANRTTVQCVDGVERTARVPADAKPRLDSGG